MSSSEIFEIIKEKYIFEMKKIEEKYPDGTEWEIKENDKDFINLCIVREYIQNYITFKPFKLLQKKAMKIFNIIPLKG